MDLTILDVDAIHTVLSSQIHLDAVDAIVVFQCPTVVVDAATAAAAEPVFLAAVPPAAAFSGSSFLCVAAEITDMAIAAVDAEMVITAGSSSFCFFSAADTAATMAAVVDAAADAATTVDADSVPVRA